MMLQTLLYPVSVQLCLELNVEKVKGGTVGTKQNCWRLGGLVRYVCSGPKMYLKCLKQLVGFKSFYWPLTSQDY